jgi:Na+-translocating ferredoxin:NAD+ oxidoreductase RnfG subunit
MKPQLKISLTLAVVCAIAAASLAAVNQVTQKAIAINSLKEPRIL